MGNCVKMPRFDYKYGMHHAYVRSLVNSPSYGILSKRKKEPSFDPRTTLIGESLQNEDQEAHSQG
jgi:hypothetical protein